MHAVTFDHYLAGIIGLGLIRHWYADGDANETRLTELTDVLSKRDAFPYSLDLTPSERSVVGAVLVQHRGAAVLQGWMDADESTAQRVPVGRGVRCDNVGLRAV